MSTIICSVISAEAACFAVSIAGEADFLRAAGFLGSAFTTGRFLTFFAAALRRLDLTVLVRVAAARVLRLLRFGVVFFRAAGFRFRFAIGVSRYGPIVKSDFVSVK